MNSALSEALSKRLAVTWCVAILAVATYASGASGQTVVEGDLFRHVETLTSSDGTPTLGPVSLSGNTAVVGRELTAMVFEREPHGDHWLHTATLAPSDTPYLFGDPVATDGDTIVVGAEVNDETRVVYLFQRAADDAWQEVARLTGDTNARSFSFVAVSGTTVVIGAPQANELGPGLVYVFEQNRGGPNAWGEVVRLVGPSHPAPGMIDHFGASVAIDHDTIIVGASLPHLVTALSTPVAYAFSRNHGGENAWGQVATLPLPPPVPSFPGGPTFDSPAKVSLSGDTAIVGSDGPEVVRIFQRDRGGPNAWGEVTALQPTGTTTSIDAEVVDIDGDLAVVSTPDTPRNLSFTDFIFSRNQGGKDNWGEVIRMKVATFVPPAGAGAIAGDTAFLGYRNVWPIDVYVADTDRDGLRDGLDPCPRDPLDNVAGGCARNSSAYLVLDDLITLGDVTTETRGNELHVTATFTNASDTAIGNPFFDVIELTGGNRLTNADGGPGGTGATLSPDVGDGMLSPGESTTVTFVIDLETRDGFRFYVSVRGEASR